MTSNQPEIHAEKLDLISSAQVRGTQVDGADKRVVGTIDHLIIDKPTGKIVCAVIEGASESVTHLSNGSHEREFHEGINRYYGLAYPCGAAYPWL